MKYDVIIPVAFNDYDFLKKSYPYLLDNLGASQIFILTDGKMSKFLPRVVRNSSIFVIVDENHLLDGLTFQRVHQLILSQGRKHTRTGWYYQQFLKMAFALSKYCVNDYYMSWDADTIPVKKIDFFNDLGQPFFTMKYECQKQYFDVMEKLVGFGKTNSMSYIAEHMMFNRNIMKELIQIIESNYNIPGNNWYEKILFSLPPEIVSVNAFSEFETYGTYCALKYPNLYVERLLNGFRLGSLIQGRFVSNRILNDFSLYDFSVVSFEIYNRPPFPWGIICEWYECKYLKFKRWLLNKFVRINSLQAQ